MRYLGLALYAEGPTDYRFLTPLLRRLADDLCLNEGNEVIEISEVWPVDAPPECEDSDRASRIREAALAARGAFNVLFVHADGAGNPEAAREHNIAPGAQQIAIHFAEDEARIVAVVPVRETEAWTLADGDALRGAFGTTLEDASLGLPHPPREVESIQDPKQVLNEVFVRVVGRPHRRRRAAQYLEAIGIRMSLQQLRRVPAFARLENDLRDALHGLGYLRD